MKRTALALAMGTIAMLLGTGCKVTVAGADTYESCFVTADCGSTRDLCVQIPGTDDTLAACSHSCSVDTDCEYGGRCLSFDGGGTFYCVARCAASFDCEVGWSCNDLGDGRANVCLPGSGGPPPGINAFDECPFGTMPDPCEAGVACWGVSVDGASAGLCTRECSSDSDCPLDARGVLGTCLAFPDQPALCWEGCGSSADCQVGWACKTMASGLTFPMICVPM